MTTTATDKTTLTYKYPEWANETLTWDLLSSIAINSAGEVILKKSYDVVLDANGEATDDLPTPDSTGDAAWLWQLNHPDGTEPNVTFAYNALSQSVAVILAASVSTSTPSDITPLLTAKVDRAGDTMTGDLTMTSASLVTPDNVQFKNTYSPTGAEPTASMFWNGDDEEMNFVADDDGTISMGKEVYEKMTNESGVLAVNGDVVSAVGATGNRQAFALTDATSAASAAACIGMVTVASIADKTPGRITKIGRVRKLNTSAYAVGALLYVDPLNPGKLTDVEPQAPNFNIAVGTVTVSSATVGVISLAIRIMPKMSELSDVNGTPLTVSGQLLVWDNANGYWDANYNLTDYYPKADFSASPVAAEPLKADGAGGINFNGDLQATGDTLTTISVNNSSYSDVALIGSAGGHPVILLRKFGTTTVFSLHANANSYFKPDNAAFHFGIGTSTPVAKLHVDAQAATNIGQIIQLAAAQTANAFEVQDSTTAVLASINASGGVDATSYSVGGAAGASGSFTTADAKTVTVVNGIITSIV